MIGSITLPSSAWPSLPSYSASLAAAVVATLCAVMNAAIAACALIAADHCPNANLRSHRVIDFPIRIVKAVMVNRRKTKS